MRIFDILTQPRPEPPKLIMPIIGFLMAVGFCLQNARLISGLAGEYQPLIFLLGCIIALVFLPIPRAALYASAILLGTSALVILFHRIAFGATTSISDMARLSVGPMIMVGTAAAWNKINARWLWGILGAYLVFAIWGMFSPESALKVIDQLGIRVNDPTNPAYFPWSAFFYSEYSYAALAFITLYCWMLARKDCESHRYMFTLLVLLLLLSTRSASAIALLPIIMVSQLQTRWIALILILLVASYFLSPRVAMLWNASLDLASGNVAAFAQKDFSSAWRFISNLCAFHVLQGYPQGTLHFDLQAYLNLPPLASNTIDTMIRAWLNASQSVAAQGVAFNYGLFGGVFSILSISAVFIFGAANAIKTRTHQTSIALIALAAYGLFIQSALTCLTPWIALGIMFSFIKRDIAHKQ